MGRTACTEPQCLYKGALYPFLPDYYEAPGCNLVRVTDAFFEVAPTFFKHLCTPALIDVLSLM